MDKFIKNKNINNESFNKASPIVAKVMSDIDQEPWTMNRIAKVHYAWLEEMGWTDVTSPLEQLALIASEIGEAVNECRGDEPTPALGSELADIILRVLGMAEGLGINMEHQIGAKMQTNKIVGNKGRKK